MIHRVSIAGRQVGFFVRNHQMGPAILATLCGDGAGLSGPARPAAQAAPRPAHSRSADSRSTDSRSTDSRPANPGPANARPAGPRAANPRAANQAQAGQPKADRGGRLRPATYGGDHPLRKPKRGPQGHAPDTDRHDAARLSATMRDLGRVAFLHRGSEPRHNPVPHRQSSGVRKHGEGRAD